VTANDIDPNAIRAVAINALANGVEIDVIGHDLLDGDGGDAELVLAGDVFYDQAMTARVVPFLRRVVARGGRVLLGDPGRADLPLDLLRVVATYSAAAAATFSDAEVSQVHVLELAGL
jgi:predicted nicotinamide N-methyase